MAKTRILLADDHALVRAGFRALLEQQPDMEVVGEAASGEEAERMVVGRLPTLNFISFSKDKVKISKPEDRPSPRGKSEAAREKPR